MRSLKVIIFVQCGELHTSFEKRFLCEAAALKAFGDLRLTPEMDVAELVHNGETIDRRTYCAAIARQECKRCALTAVVNDAGMCAACAPSYA